LARHRPKQLAKLLEYILGRRPDEFGLVPDSDGFVPLKELLQSVGEEEGWSYVRLADIREVLMIDPKRFETAPEGIRMNPGRALPHSLKPQPAVPPEILYYGARQKAYPHILNRGLSPTRHPLVVLATTEQLALRIGRRRDPKPFLVKIHAARAHQDGIAFLRLGELLYLVESLAATYLEGPPIPSEKPAPRKTPQKETYRPAGAFEIDLQSIPRRIRQEKERRVQAWKKEARRYRRMREKGRY